MDGHDIDDYWRSMQLRRLFFYGRYTGHTAGSLVCCHHSYTLFDIPQGTAQFRWKSWMLHVHCGLGCHRHECTPAVICHHDTRDEVFRHRAWISNLRRNNHSLMCIHRVLGRAQIWEEEHVGIFEHLQFDWRAECGGYPRAGCCRRYSD